jgi:cyclopropane fatty-acyl-phospholipid synthase-like methyltransferase
MSSEPNWVAYYSHTTGREPRPLFAKGMAAAGSLGVRPGQAVEVGFGDGTETLALLRAGWSVVAVDPTPEAAAALRANVPPADAERLQILTAPGQSADLPPFDLLYAGYALSFIPPKAFATFWAKVRAGLRPGGFLICNVFGVRDTWAQNKKMTFATRDDVDRLVDGLEILALDEEDQDGDAFSGAKHWHLFDVVARRRVGDE